MLLRQATRNKDELHPLERSVLEYLRAKGLELKKGCYILIALSGGPDSVALFTVLIALKKLLEVSKYGVVHFNHKLRKEADDDEAFVRNLSSAFNVEFFSGSENVKDYAIKRRISIEMAARECRYRFFFALKERLRADYLAVGHTGSDQAEEVLLRLIRGTGPDGFSGMPLLSANGILRPLLGVFRSDVISYLSDLRMPYKVDTTNFSAPFQRNRIRHEVIPLLDEISGRSVEKIICRTAELFADDAGFIKSVVEQAWNEITTPSADKYKWSWDREKFRKSQIGLQRRLIRRLFEEAKGDLYGLSFEHVENFRRFIAEGHSGGRLELYGLSAVIEGSFVGFSIKKVEEGASTGYALVIPTTGRYHIEPTGDSLILSFLSQSEAMTLMDKGSTSEALFDADKLIWPLVLRFWQPGDRFQPLGMKGRSKKVQDFFTDEKIPLSRRHKIPILCDQEKICWIVGLRMDERARITESTERFLLVRHVKAQSPTIAD